MASSFNPAWEQQLLTLRSVTDTTGAVHEAQLHQLRYWGAIAFTTKGWTADIDVENRVVTYSLEKKSKDKNLANAVAALDRSVHWLFGDTWQLLIKEAGVVIYMGQKMDMKEYRQKSRNYRQKKAKKAKK